MPITFEEISGEVVPEQYGSEPSRQESRETRRPGELDERIRAALARERRLAERLCDR